MTNAVRTFQGQSKWLANAQLGWRGDVDNLSFILNYTGRRQALLGVFGAGDEYENPPLLLDFVYSREFEWGSNILEVSLEAGNLLGDGIEYVQDGVVTEGYDIGRTFSIGFKYKF